MYHGVEVARRRRLYVERRRGRPRLADHVPVARPLRRRDEPELNRVPIDRARGRRATGLDRGRPVLERDERDRPFLHAAGTLVPSAPAGVDPTGHAARTVLVRPTGGMGMYGHACSGT